VLHLNAEVAGLRRHRFTWHVGPPRDTIPADRVADPATWDPWPDRPARKADFIMDLQADKGVPLSLNWTDEMGNATAAPAGASTVYTVDDAGIVALVDNGDGTATASATGELGTANVHVEIAVDGRTLTGDLQIVVVAGDAERVEVAAGDPFEVTPDV
jgi:hypothetical protein